ncbi:MAG TPA: MbnP family protein [Polyangia bacterium]|nr:MbnP family protein [Polyangia bacterium]
MAGGAGCQGASASALTDAAAETPVAIGGASDQPVTTGDACPESPAPRFPTGALLQLPLALQFRGATMRFGEPNAAGGGATVTPLNVRFYLSQVALIRTGGAGTVPVDVVDASGQPLPYGVHFFNGEDPITQVLRIRAPAGQYDGITFSFGLGDECNAGPPERNPPLSAASQMTWPHGFGYLFFRYEARVSGGSGPDAGGDGDGGVAVGDGGDSGAADDSSLPGLPAAIHMGGWPHLVLAPTARAAGALAVTDAPPSTRTLFLVMDEVFRGAGTPAKSALPLAPPGAEAAAGENLRQAAKALTLFVLAP